MSKRDQCKWDLYNLVGKIRHHDKYWEEYDRCGSEEELETSDFSKWKAGWRSLREHYGSKSFKQAETSVMEHIVCLASQVLAEG